MAGEQVQRQQDYIHQQHNRSHADAEAVVKKESAEGVMPKKRNEHHRHVKKIAVQVLQDEWELGLAKILAARFFGDRAAGRIAKESPVVRLAIVVTGGP